MFSRLLKYEWKANAKVLGILSLAAGGIGILATVVLRLLLRYGENQIFIYNVWAVLAAAAMGMFLFFGAIALSIYVIAVQVILLYRFYKSKFTDEGYLTFTLPVKTTEIFWSSFVNILLWLLITIAIVVAIVFVVILFGTAETGLINRDVFVVIGELIDFFAGEDWIAVLTESGGAAYLVILVLTALVSPFYALFVPMCCITVGAVLAKKHKILASFGIYYGVNFVVGIITSVATVVPSLFLLSNNDIAMYYTVSGAVQLTITTALTLGAYFLTIYLMKHKLNLP